MKKFKLWLDESGAFNDDNLREDFNPSLVGGLLCEYSDFSENIVKSIIPEAVLHSCETEDARAVDVLEKVLKYHGTPVVFVNYGKHKIIDADTTYLNICCDGIIKIIRDLLNKYGSIDIDILIATRRATSKKDEFGKMPGIKFEEYRSRLEEKLLIGLIKSGLDTTKIKKNVRFDSAYRRKELMIADSICNLFLVQNSRKFADYRESINEIISKYKVYSGITQSLEEKINDYLNQNNITDGILEYASSTEKSNIEVVEDNIIKALKGMNREIINSQFNILKEKLEELIKFDRDFVTAKRVLTVIEDSFIPKLRANNINCDELEIYIKICFISLYTHIGDITLTEKYLVDVEDVLKSEDFNISMNVLDIWFRTRNKLGVHYINEFDFPKAIEILDENIKNIEFVNELYKEIMTTLFEKEMNSNSMSEELGKSLGTRLQAKILLSRVDKSVIPSAIEDSDRALEFFKGRDGYNRQLQYRSQLELEIGNFENALLYLNKSILGQDEISKEKIIDNILDNKSGINYFNLMHYCRIMSEAALSNNKIADSLYCEINKKIGLIDLFNEEEISNTNHPIEIVYWKMATYLAVNANKKAALKNYDKALKVLKDVKGPTRLVIKLAILTEKAHFISQWGKDYASDIKKIDREIQLLIDELVSNDTSISKFVYKNFNEFNKNYMKASRTVAY